MKFTTNKPPSADPSEAIVHLPKIPKNQLPKWLSPTNPARKGTQASGRSTLQKSGLSMRQLRKLPVEVAASTSMTSESRRTSALARLRSSTCKGSTGRCFNDDIGVRRCFFNGKKMKVLESIVTWAVKNAHPKSSSKNIAIVWSVNTLYWRMGFDQVPPVSDPLPQHGSILLANTSTCKEEMQWQWGIKILPWQSIPHQYG